MRVAHVTLRFDAPGGVETNVREVTTRLRRAGVDVTVHASDLYDEAGWVRRPGRGPSVDGVPVQWYPVYRRLVPGLTMPLMTGLIRGLDRERPAIVHAHSHRYGHVLESAAVCEARGIPLVVSTHYHPADRREPWLKRGLLRCQDVGFGATAYRVASALVVETELEARLVREFAPPDRIHVIPPGIDLDAWRADPTGEVPPPGLPARYLLYAGRVASNKRLDQLIAALALLPSSERIPLVVMGRDWGERAHLDALIRDRGLSEWVRFLDHVESPAAYRAVFRRATLFVLPSEWEAFGLVLLEAMAAEVGIVAASVGGVPEVLEEGRCGRLVPFGDPETMARAIQSLWQSPTDRARLVAEGRRRVEGLTWDRSAAAHLALYRELAVPGGARS